jgi:hypothetical protein
MFNALRVMAKVASQGDAYNILKIMLAENNWHMRLVGTGEDQVLSIWCPTTNKELARGKKDQDLCEQLAFNELDRLYNYDEFADAVQE